MCPKIVRKNALICGVQNAKQRSLKVYTSSWWRISCQCLRVLIFGIGSYKIREDSDVILCHLIVEVLLIDAHEFLQSCCDHFELKNPPTRLQANNLSTQSLVYLLQRMQESQLAVSSKHLLTCLVNGRNFYVPWWPVSPTIVSEFKKQVMLVFSTAWKLLYCLVGSPCVSGSFSVAVVVSSHYVFWAGEKLLKKQM